MSFRAVPLLDEDDYAANLNVRNPDLRAQMQRAGESIPSQFTTTLVIGVTPLEKVETPNPLRDWMFDDPNVFMMDAMDVPTKEMLEAYGRDMALANVTSATFARWIRANVEVKNDRYLNVLTKFALKQKFQRIVFDMGTWKGMYHITRAPGAFHPGLEYVKAWLRPGGALYVAQEYRTTRALAQETNKARIEFLTQREFDCELVPIDDVADEFVKRFVTSSRYYPDARAMTETFYVLKATPRAPLPLLRGGRSSPSPSRKKTRRSRSRSRSRLRKHAAKLE